MIQGTTTTNGPLTARKGGNFKHLIRPAEKQLHMFSVLES